MLWLLRGAGIVEQGRCSQLPVCLVSPDVGLAIIECTRLLLAEHAHKHATKSSSTYDVLLYVPNCDSSSPKVDTLLIRSF
jgi:hypothetical protein